MDRPSRSNRSCQATALRLTGLAFLVSLVATSSSALAQDEPPSEPVQPETTEIGMLFAHTAKRGALKPVEGKPRFTLKLRRVAPQVVWFSDRPARQSGHMPVRGFVGGWAGFGFVEDPPNAALTVLDAPASQDTVILTLGQPRYRAKRNTVRYPARILDEASGNLSHLESQRDHRLRRHFRAASLFIDDASAPVIGGCVIQPYTKCAGAELSHANLAGANLAGADLFAAYLIGANLTGANLAGAKLNRADLLNAYLLGANLAGANLAGAKLTNADLTNADLTDAELFGANLTGARLIGADLTRASLFAAKFCKTLMPNGSINNRGC